MLTLADGTKLLAAILSRLRRGRLTCFIPQHSAKTRILPGMHFHPWPEIFFQIRGSTEFRLPNQRFLLRPGKLCLLPRGMAHDESTHCRRGQFRNLVLGFGKNSVSLHFGGKGTRYYPAIVSTVFARGAPALRLAGRLDDAGELYLQNTTRSRLAAHALLTAHFACLLDIFEEKIETPPVADPRLTLCQHLVARNLSDPGLTVAKLAEWLHCAPDYLSHYYRQKTGVALKAYINQQRLEMAREALLHTLHSIKEISGSCGYRNPNYFIRVFKKETGHTPLHFRRARPPAALI
jgi:AraC-like DNA-binding protein